MSVVFLSDTFPSVSRGLVQIQWNLGCRMTSKNSTRLRFSPNPMKFGTLGCEGALIQVAYKLRIDSCQLA